MMRENPNKKEAMAKTCKASASITKRKKKNKKKMVENLGIRWINMPNKKIGEYERNHNDMPRWITSIQVAQFHLVKSNTSR